MGGIVTRTAKEKQAEWQEAKVVRRNTVVNVATLAELASKPLPVRKASLRPRVVLHECPYERLYVENEPSNVMYNVMYPSNVDGLPEIEWECALREVSAAAEETFAKATLGFGADAGRPAGSWEGPEHLHSHSPASPATRLGAWGAEPPDSWQPATRRRSILRRTSFSLHDAQAGGDNTQGSHDVLAVNAGGEERAEQTGRGAHGVLTTNAGGEEQAPHNGGALPRPRHGLVHVASLQAWGSDSSREMVIAKLLEVEELPQDASGESHSSRDWDNSLPHRREFLLRQFSFAEERVSPAAATSTSSSFSFTNGCGESNSGDANTGDAELPQEASAVTAHTNTAPDEHLAQAGTVDVSAR
jgi:hypothetical protein